MFVTLSNGRDDPEHFATRDILRLIADAIEVMRRQPDTIASDEAWDTWRLLGPEDGEVLPLLNASVSDASSNEWILTHAMRAIRRIDPEAASVEAVVKHLHHPQWDVRRDALHLLRSVSDAGFMPAAPSVGALAARGGEFVSLRLYAFYVLCRRMGGIRAAVRYIVSDNENEPGRS